MDLAIYWAIYLYFLFLFSSRRWDSSPLLFQLRVSFNFTRNWKSSRERFSDDNMLSSLNEIARQIKFSLYNLATSQISLSTSLIPSSPIWFELIFVGLATLLEVRQTPTLRIDSFPNLGHFIHFPLFFQHF